MSLRAFALLAFAAAGTASTGPEDPVRLRVRFTPGEVLRQRYTQTQTMDAAGVGETETRSVFVLRQSVEEVSPEGVATLAVRYEAIKMEAGGPMPMSYDSTREGEAAKENSEALARMFEPMLEADLRMVIEPSGRVTDIDGFEKVLEGLDAAGPAAAPMKEMLNEESMRQLVEVNVFPDGPLETGASWERAFDLKLLQLGKMVFEFENTFSGIETRAGARCARIDVSGTTSFEKSGEATELEIEMDDGEIEGGMWVTIDQGRVVESRISMTGIVMRMSAPGLDEPFEMKIENETSSRLLGKDDPPFDD